MSSEIWKDIKRFEGCYQMSDYGRVRSLDRVVRYRDGRMSRRYRGQIIKLACNNSGYLYVTLWKNKVRKRLLVGPLVGVLFVNSKWAGEWDHHDRNKNNNTAKNMRPATRSQNNANRKSKGIRYRHGKWYARIKVRGKEVSLGHFPTAEEATQAYQKAAIRFFGAFANVSD